MKTWVEIHENAIKNNIEQLRSLIQPGTRFCAVVKANAYGHGQKEIVNIAARMDVDAFAVDTLDDALELRKRLPSAILLVLGYTLRQRLEEAVESNIHLTMYDRESIELFEAAASRRAAVGTLHLKLETGTNRQGARQEDLQRILGTIQDSTHLKLAGISTHFANIEDTSEATYAGVQFARFRELVASIQEAGFDPSLIHCSNSAATILYPDTHGSMVRIGIALYGLWPSEEVEQVARRHNVRCDLEPALTWKAKIAQVKSVPAGESISYGLTERVSRNSRIAVIPVGYWDGYDRQLSSVGYVLVKGQRCKVMGRVCMNMFMVDVSGIPNVEPEEEVILLGKAGRYSISAEEMAKWCNTINYEVITRINPQIPRIVV